jgi:hypothetical protein
VAKRGSNPGERRGGRKKGTPNRFTSADTKRAVEAEARLAETGESPRDYMLRVMRDPAAKPERRDAMAKAVAPYCHPQLAAVKHSGDKDNPIIQRIERVIVSPHDNAENPDGEGVPSAPGAGEV